MHGSTATRRPLRGGIARALGGALSVAVALAACTQTGPQQPEAEVAIVGLEATTYVNDSVTFTVAVVGGPYDSLELRRDGELFQVLEDESFTWDVSAVPEGSYSFVARLRRGTEVVDSAPKAVVVDRTPPTVTLEVTPEQEPLLAGSGHVQVAAAAADDVLLDRVELLDGADELAGEASGTLELQLTPERGVHAYVARAVDRAGNEATSGPTTVVAYVRESHQLGSEASLDGCVSAGYEPQLFTRDFASASCGWTTTWSILHFFSFDRSAFPDALVEAATLRFYREESYDPEVHLASVEYESAEEAPPIGFIYPFESTVPETLLVLDTSVGTKRHAIDVTELVQADVAAGRPRSQLRLRTQALGPSALGGTGFYAEVGDERAPTLDLDLLVP